MPWVPAERCEVCGSTDIRLVPDEDRSVGYYSEEWICENGHNVEEWHEYGELEPARPRR